MTKMEAIPQSDPDEPLAATQDSQPETEPQKKCCSCTPERLVCVSHALSAWGDRMWEFAVALYLVELTPGSLRLTAIFELVRALCIIFLGPFVGNWVDGNTRLRVAQISLLVQNVSVAASALLLLLILSVNLSKGLFIIVVSLVMITACLSVLAGIATKISIEKDWVIVISGTDKAVLAGTNAVLRRIDLICKIMAPALVGQIMTYVSKSAGVILIAVWNIVSVFFEYYMLLRVFHAVPSLAIKKIDQTRHGDTAQSTSSEQAQGSRDRLDWMERENRSPENTEEDIDALVPQTVTRRPRRQEKASLFQRFKTKADTMKVGFQIYMRQSVVLPGLSLACVYFTVLSFSSITTGYIYTQNVNESILSILRGVGSLFGVLATFVFPRMRNSLGLIRSGLFSMSAQFACMLICLIAVFTPGSPFLLLPDSWRFHGSTVTTHHIHNISQGNCSIAAITPSLSKEFAYRHANQLKFEANISKFSNSTSNTTFFSSTPLTISFSQSLFSWSSAHLTTSLKVTTAVPSRATTSILSSPSNTLHATMSSVSFSPSPTSAIVQPSSSPIHGASNCTVDEVIKKKISHNFSYVSISLLVIGIILSRFGLWLSDLSITQLQQETVPEEERGIVGAMQKAFNSVLDMSMYIFVICLPKPEEFGILAIMSVAAIGCAGIMYSRYAYKARGHLFHFEKIKRVFVRTSNDGPSHRNPSREILNAEDEEEDEMISEVLSTKNENFKY